MIKTARQLKDLIRNLSKDKSADAQILMRNYMMERFLERISLSEYKRFAESRSRWIYPSFQNTNSVFCGDLGSAPTSMKQAGSV